MKDMAITLPQQYLPIMAKIESTLALATLDSEGFNKSSSQFKLATLDVTDLTPINSAKHLLAVIQRTRQALEEASINLRRKNLELSTKEREIIASQGDESEVLLIDIDELKLQVNNIEAQGRGAVRKLANALDSYQTILISLGVEHLTELDYEKDQARYHIMTAFNQALTSARARGGLIDEGNHIYLFQLGINGAMAQREVTALLEEEQRVINEGLEASHDGVIRWLNIIADKYEQAPKIYASSRNMNTLNKTLMVEGK